MLLQSLLLLLGELMWIIVMHFAGTFQQYLTLRQRLVGSARSRALSQWLVGSWWSWTLSRRLVGSCDVEGGMMLRPLESKLAARQKQVS